MYIHGLIPRNFAESAKAVPIANMVLMSLMKCWTILLDDVNTLVFVFFGNKGSLARFINSY